jgi:hypothetical protein
LADPKRASPALSAVMDNVFVSVTCRDDFTLVMALKQPSPAILALLADAHTVMMKAGIAEQVDRKDPKFLVVLGRSNTNSIRRALIFVLSGTRTIGSLACPTLTGTRRW